MLESQTHTHTHARIEAQLKTAQDKQKMYPDTNVEIRVIDSGDG